MYHPLRFVLALLQVASTLPYDADTGTRLEIGRAGEDEIAFALAGGNLRAASVCFGTLRGFTQKKVLDSITGEQVPAMNLVTYNSGISGGSIPAMLYTYASVPTEDLLETDRTIDPSKITKEELARMPKTSMGFVLTQKPDSLKLGLRFFAGKILTNPFNLLKWHTIWTSSVHQKMFKPLNIPKDKSFTSSKEERDNILEEYPNLKESDFLKDDMKTLPMILATMHGSRADNNEYMTKMNAIKEQAWKEYKAQETVAYFTNSFEKRPNMTDIVLSIRDKEDYGGNLPMPYVFTPDVVENKYSGNVLVRKNMIQFPEKNVRTFEWGSKKGRHGRKHRMSVEMLTGISTNFPGSADITAGQFLSQIRKIPLSDGSEVTQKFEDGGTSDLMGIIPLVG